MGRNTVLLGSLPGSNAEEAMSLAIERTGGRLTCISDGETGERHRWVARIVDTFRDHPDLEVAREGDQSDYDKQLHFRVRRGHRLTADSIDLGYLVAYRESRPVFDRIREKYQKPDLAFQVGIPGDLDVALFSMGPVRVWRYRSLFTAATVRELAAIQQKSGGDVVFQLELPAETLFVVMAGGPAAAPVARLMTRGIRRVAAAAPVGTRFAVHLCVGDLGHRAMSTPGSTRPLVRLANTIARAWPAGRTLERVHLPLAAGEKPPPLEPEFYGPLHQLRLPVGTRFAAGFLHEDRTLDEQRTILDTIENLVGHEVDVAAACGLGRRDPEKAYLTYDQARELTAS